MIHIKAINFSCCPLLGRQSEIGQWIFSKKILNCSFAMWSLNWCITWHLNFSSESPQMRALQRLYLLTPSLWRFKFQQTNFGRIQTFSSWQYIKGNDVFWITERKSIEKYEQSQEHITVYYTYEIEVTVEDIREIRTENSSQSQIYPHIYEITNWTGNLREY
jgi:adenylate kinase family enzyme